MFCNPEQSLAVRSQLFAERRMISEMLDLLRHEENWCQNVLQNGFTEKHRPVVCLLGAATFVALPPHARPMSDDDALLNDQAAEPSLVVRLARTISTKNDFVGVGRAWPPNVERSELRTMIMDYNDQEGVQHADILDVLRLAYAAIDSEMQNLQPNFNWFGRVDYGHEE